MENKKQLKYVKRIQHLNYLNFHIYPYYFHTKDKKVQDFLDIGLVSGNFKEISYSKFIEESGLNPDALKLIEELLVTEEKSNWELAYTLYRTNIKEEERCKIQGKDSGY